MSCNASDIWQFISYFRELVGIGPKNRFFGSFIEVFHERPLTPFDLRPNFYAKWKVSWRYIIVVSFICITFVVPKLKCSNVSWRWSIHQIAPFGKFVGPFSSRYSSILVNIFPRDSLSYVKQITSAIFQKFVFKQKRDVLKVYSFGPYLEQIYPWKVQNIAKRQFFGKNHILRTMK